MNYGRTRARHPAGLSREQRNRRLRRAARNARMTQYVELCLDIRMSRERRAAALQRIENAKRK